MPKQREDCLFCSIAREGAYLHKAKGFVAINDINPQAPVHILVIPKGAYVSWDDFSERGSAEEIAGFVRAVGHIAREQGLVAPGYRLLANVGANSGQEVPHLHVHLFGGRPLGPMAATWTTSTQVSPLSSVTFNTVL